jgi:murein DD-endopeptidase MepM/ murein hydrolase activator NlpD
LLKKVSILVLICLSSSLFGQKVKQLAYPQNYFLFPIKPGQINHLSGALGDLRTNHFHGGLDIKTDQREGLFVYAAADGYVKEIRVSTGGYGNGLYLKHPNGMVTVYGHLKAYEGAIKEYMLAQRKEKKTFEISILPEPNQIKVKKGDIIGLSGNTGGSGGPHLHFEIRNELNHLLNPIYFGFNEIKDTQSAHIQSLIVKPIGINSRVNGLFGKQYFAPMGSAGNYFLPKNIEAIGEIGFELMAYDKMNFNGNNYGISCMEVLVNNTEKFYYHLETIPVEDSKDINVHMDFALEKQTGKKYHRLYLSDGNDQLPIYKNDHSKGKLSIEEGKTYSIQIKVWDSNENLSELSFNINGVKNTESNAITNNKLPISTSHYIDENTLVITAENLKDSMATCTIGIAGKAKGISASYVNGNKSTFLYDLRNGLPQFYELDDQQVDLNFKTSVPSKQHKIITSENFSIEFGKNSLYDTLHLEVVKKGLGFKVGEPSIPLREPIKLKLKLPHNYDPARTHIYYVYGNNTKYLNTTWEGTWATFETKTLGEFRAIEDIDIPKISPLTTNKNRLVLRINDSGSDIKNFKAELNGEYILMDYDYKKDLIWTIEPDSTNNFVGNLKVTVSDQAGNVAVYEEEILEVEPKPKVAKKSSKSNKKVVQSKKKKKNVKNRR